MKNSIFTETKKNTTLRGRFKSWLHRNYNVEDRKAMGFCYLLLALPFLFFIVFWVVVNINSVLLAFQDVHGNFTLKNFKTLFENFSGQDSRGLYLSDVFKRTFIVWFVVQLVLIPSLFSTYILFKRLPGHYIFRTIYMVPGVLGGMVLTMIYKYFVGANGPLLSLAEMMGINIPLEVQMKGLLGSSATAFTTLNLMIAIPGIFGFNFVVSGAYARIPVELFEVGKLDGIGFVREFFTVSLPLIWGTLIITVIGAMAGLFTTDNGSFLYTKGQYDTACMGYYIFIYTKEVADSRGKQALLGYPSALGVFITLITLPIVLITRRIMEKVNDVAY